MSNCSNCFNGCAEIVSDKCVKYTGVEISSLEISNGDTLCTVIIKLSDFLMSALNGTGIVIPLSSQDLCELINQYLPQKEDINLVDIITALIKSSCNLNEQVSNLNISLDILNSNYIVGCLTDIENDSDTHEIVQSIINKLCNIDQYLTSLSNTLDATCVKLDNLIAQYLVKHPQ